MNRPELSRALLLTAVLVALPLAGCASEEGDGTPDSFDSYEEAKAADGRVYEEHGTLDLHLKLLVPEDPDNAAEGKQPIVFLLFDGAADAPVTDAQVALVSNMPAMGHGTNGEVDPTHQGHGVYRGETNHIMSGDWDVEITVDLDGESYEFSIPYRVNQ